jgi:hypothetical protein
MYILNLQDAVILLGLDKVSKDIKYMSILTYNLWYRVVSKLRHNRVS